MHAALLLMASTMGVTYGWQPAGNGGLEYIIQIEPTLADRMQDGELITSEIPPEVRGLVRRFRVQIGTDAVPRTGILHDVRKGTGQPRIDDRNGERLDNKSNAWDNPRSGASGDRSGNSIFGPRTDDRWRYEDGNKPSTPAQPPPDRTASTASSIKEADAPKAESSDKKSDTVTAGLSGPQGWTLIAIIGFFVSLGANVYQGWLLTTHRRHYDRLVNTLYARNSTTVG